MVQAIRAIYESGHLRLLDPVELIEGQQISITLLPDRELVRAALGDLLVQTRDISDETLDETALMQEIADAFAGQAPLSETIIEERREGP